MRKTRWELLIFDTLVYLICALFVMVIYPSTIVQMDIRTMIALAVAGWMCISLMRMILFLYQRIWRYAGPHDYISLMAADATACIIFLLIRAVIPGSMTAVRALSLFTSNLLGCILIRMLYQWAYQRRAKESRLEKAALFTLKWLTGVKFSNEHMNANRIRIAIIGAGSIGVMLADELLQNPKATYEPVCFVDIDSGKVGRQIYEIPVIGSDTVATKLQEYQAQEVVFALPNLSTERREELYTLYKGLGYKIKAYDYPTLGDGKRSIHDFDIEDLLFRSPEEFLNEKTQEWYQGKNVLITGGGGSIGSELARQIARCKPARLVLLDIYENGAYDVQQELLSKYGKEINLRIEIASVCDREKTEKIFADHTPDIVLHAAAHKHVPLMERNVCEAVSNNVFGTLNVVELCEKYKVKRFIMISTDKAVNPTNVMGATKRMCEMIVQSRTGESTSFSATRFGNVLGSNGSVIPLFKRQIANGGPITLTDKRIIRYFMTIPEASQLVMTSGAMARNGELYVLDMGKPVKILNLAENMIRLSGLEPYKDIDIVETGLRPGEKLYEELLIKNEELDKTENDRIFVERDKPLQPAEIAEKLQRLREALKTQSNRTVRQALMEVVPTYHTPDEVNEQASTADEMQMANREGESA